jgi:hypothetical protein
MLIKRVEVRDNETSTLTYIHPNKCVASEQLLFCPGCSGWIMVSRGVAQEEEKILPGADRDDRD